MKTLLSLGLVLGSFWDVLIAVLAARAACFLAARQLLSSGPALFRLALMALLLTILMQTNPDIAIDWVGTLDDDPLTVSHFRQGKLDAPYLAGIWLSRLAYALMLDWIVQAACRRALRAENPEKQH